MLHVYQTWQIHFYSLAHDFRVQIKDFKSINHLIMCWCPRPKSKLQFFLFCDPDSKRTVVPMSKFLGIFLSFKVKVEVDFSKVFPLLQSRFQRKFGANVKVLKGWWGCSINIQKWNSLDEEFLAKYRNCTNRAPDYDSSQRFCHKSSTPLKRLKSPVVSSLSRWRWNDVVDLQNPWHTCSHFKKLDSNQVC